MFWILLIFLLFRWPILGRFLGVKKMYLFDAVMWVAIAASNFAATHMLWLSYICGTFSIYMCYKAGKRFLDYKEVTDEPNSGPA